MIISSKILTDAHYSLCFDIILIGPFKIKLWSRLLNVSFLVGSPMHWLLSAI